MYWTMSPVRRLREQRKLRESRSDPGALCAARLRVNEEVYGHSEWIIITLLFPYMGVEHLVLTGIFACMKTPSQDQDTGRRFHASSHVPPCRRILASTLESLSSCMPRGHSNTVPVNSSTDSKGGLTQLLDGQGNRMVTGQ
ncbi:hypothetical protein BDY19DRAFT_903038 [Irpex rosettiformis]|uniref:Uncharacterized protein n=1 Tax=Irpex rosettiformis TaxID=378272 RepID=A0ACB8UFY2_9APHY|nr:hypothetical protein BDY19DRAFT_903038 [Irpex rosettiformis]